MGFFEDRDDVGPPPDPFRIGRGNDLRFPIPLRWIGLIAALLIAFVVLNVAKSVYVDLLWFESVGFDALFREVLLTRVVLFVLGAVVAGVTLGVNVWAARRLAPRGFEESFIEDVDPEAIRRIVQVALIAATLFLAVVFGVVAAGAWETILSWQNGVSFGLDDPAFDRDISFYLFDLPAYHLIQGWLLGLLVVATLGAGAVYGLSFSLQQFTLNVTTGMRIHLSVLVGLILFVITFGTWLSIFDLATSPAGIVTGATYTDINARLPVRWVLIALGAFAGLATIVNAFISNQYRVPIFAVGLWAVAGIVGGLVYPNFVQSFQVDPNELEKESQFIGRNITFTRVGFGLEDIEVINFPAEATVTEAEIAANPATISNIRLLDSRPLKDTFNQIQSIRPLYLFNDVDTDRYVIDGNLAQVMLSARELDLRRAQSSGDSGWTRERLQLTHGYGAVVAPVSEVTPEGLPALITQDIPPQGEAIPITEDGARIYFGELTNHYVIVDTNVAEFDYPQGAEFAETFYEPDAGISLGNFLRRFALFWDLGDTNLLISGQLGSDSRVLLNRSLRQRIPKVAPFLSLDTDPYLVVDEGRLLWIQDAYTTSSRFPYSEHLGEINYIRNSVKVVVDALTGDMTFYLMDPDDPIAATWAKIFPALFTSLDEMPPNILAHLRYPEDLFRIQSEQYLAYHITDPQVFFVGEDVWNVPTEKFRQQEQLVEPYYVVMTLPGETKEEFVLILPFTPRSKQNTIAWLAGRSDGDNYGKLRAYRFPTDDLVVGPAQIEARIDQTTGISQQLTLWDQSGSEVIRGNLLMIPIGDSFLYVEPIYLQAETSRFPELKRVVVANGDTIAMEPTFEAALEVVFGQRASTLPGAEPGGAAITPPSAQPTPRPPAATTGPLPADLLGLLSEAQAASDGAQAELDRLRSILEAIEALGETSP